MERPAMNVPWKAMPVIGFGVHVHERHDAEPCDKPDHAHPHQVTHVTLPVEGSANSSRLFRTPLAYSPSPWSTSGFQGDCRVYQRFVYH